jgi:predicted nucleic acid-binding protein
MLSLFCACSIQLHFRREAVHRGLAVIGTLGLLAEAAHRNLLNLPRVLADLQATHFHVSPGLIEVLLANDAKRRARPIVEENLG